MSGSKSGGLRFDDVCGEIEHFLRDLDVLDIVEILVLVANFVRISQQHADKALSSRLERDDVLAVGQDDAGDRDLVHGADGLADHGVGIVTDLAVRNDVVGPHDIKFVDLGPRHEFVDVDGAVLSSAMLSSSSLSTVT